MPGLDYTKFAGNPFNQQVEPLDQTEKYAPTSKTYHGITLVVNGNVLGRIQSWDNTGAYTRAATHVFELNNRTWGRPVDLVPGKADGYTIAAEVAELWGSEIEIQTGSTDRYIDLVSQVRPFEAQEFWFRGSEPYEVWTYLGCWLTDRNETAYSSEGDARVMARFNFSYVSRSHTAGTA
jgi:hypothetical protein